MIRLLYIIATLCIFMPITSQSINTMYFMERVPQATSLNPAIQPKCNVYVGMFGIASLQPIFGNNSLSMNSFLQKGKNDSLIFFLHPDANRNLFFDDLKSKNNLFFDLNYEFFSFGFRVKDWYFNFGTSVRGDVTASYPKDFMKLMLTGFDVGDNYDLKHFAINSTLYLEAAFGASWKINDEWTVGAKYKLLNGLFNIYTNNSTFTFESVEENDLFNLKINSDLNLNTYMPIMTETPDTGDIEFDQMFNTRNDIENGFKPFESMGMGFDLGVTYSGFDQFILSASIIDLGFINWKGNVNNYSMKIDNYQYTPPEIDLNDLDINIDAIQDSITSAFSTKKTKNAYTTALPVKMYLGGEYFPIKYVSFGLLSLTQYYRQQFYQQVMLSANFRPLNMLMLSTSYSVFDNGFSNIGFGITGRILPAMQIYAVADNIPFRFTGGSIPLPYKIKNFGFRFGMNWVFGCSNKRKEKDKPLNYE